MRSTQALLALALCLATVNALRDPSPEQKQEQQDQQQQQQQTSFDVPPVELTEEQLKLARQGIKDILATVPIQTVEPLFSTMRGYCKAFSVMCTLACEERRLSESEYELGTDQNERKRKLHGNQSGSQNDEAHGGADTKADGDAEETTGRCGHPEAKSAAQAQAMCQCAGYDLTDRVNFAM